MNKCDSEHPYIQVGTGAQCIEMNGVFRCVRSAYHEDGYHVTYSGDDNYYWRTGKGKASPQYNERMIYPRS